MIYFAILDNEVLFEEINFHPVFSYGLMTYRNAYPQIKVFVDPKYDIELVKEYHDHVFPLNELKKEGKILELNNPLLAKRHLSGLIDKCFYFKVKDKFDLISARSLIESDFCESRPIKINKRFSIEHFHNHLKPKLLFTAPYSFFDDLLRQKIESNFDVTFCYQAPKEVVKNLIADSDAIFTSTCPPYFIDDDLFKNAANLRIVATPSTGTTHLDINAISKRGIHIISIKSSDIINSIYASSEYSFTLLLSMVNKLGLVSNSAKFGAWRENEELFRTNELNGKTIGIIGFGRIGKMMARFSNAMGMNVVIYDPFVISNDTKVTQLDSKEELLINSDIVSLHYHLSAETENSFNADDFAIMKKGAFFLNTARAELVDEEAMLESLSNGHLKGAAVDVITYEYMYDKWNHPVVKFSREHDNLVLSPHVAGLTIESERKSANDIIDQLIDYFENK